MEDAFAVAASSTAGAGSASGSTTDVSDDFVVVHGLCLPEGDISFYGHPWTSHNFQIIKALCSYPTWSRWG